jgi:hypothetical protein
MVWSSISENVTALILSALIVIFEWYMCYFLFKNKVFIKI